MGTRRTHLTQKVQNQRIAETLTHPLVEAHLIKCLSSPGGQIRKCYIASRLNLYNHLALLLIQLYPMLLPRSPTISQQFNQLNQKKRNRKESNRMTHPEMIR